MPGAARQKSFCRAHQVREALGLGADVFAQLMGVNPSTVYRWETAAGAAEKAAPFQAALLVVLEELTHRGHGAGLGAQITSAIQVGGSLRGLHLVLRAFYSGSR